MQHLKEIVLPNYPLILSLLKYRNVWVFWNKKKIVLLNYPLDLSLLKYRNVWVFWNKKKSGSNRCSPLNSSIDRYRWPKNRKEKIKKEKINDNKVKKSNINQILKKKNTLISDQKVKNHELFWPNNTVLLLWRIPQSLPLVTLSQYSPVTHSQGILHQRVYFNWVFT